MKLCVVIPAFNECNFIYRLVSETHNFMRDVIVVDDGSLDNTFEEAKRAGAIVLRHNINKGKGKALKTGLEYALSKNYDAVITLDGDGQHNPSDIVSLIHCVEKTGADIVIGTRYRNSKNMPLVRIFTNITSSLFISFLVQRHLTDVHSGFRLIKSKVLRNIYLKKEHFDFDIELILKAVRAGFKIAEVNIQTIYGTEKSKINPIADTLRYFNTIAYCLVYN